MKMYQVVEQVNGKNETYMMMFENDAEMSYWLNGKRMWINEKKDSIVAWYVGKEGEAWINLEKYWNLYSRKAA